MRRGWWGVGCVSLCAASASCGSCRKSLALIVCTLHTKTVTHTPHAKKKQKQKKDTKRDSGEWQNMKKNKKSTDRNRKLAKTLMASDGYCVCVRECVCVCVSDWEVG